MSAAGQVSKWLWRLILLGSLLALCFSAAVFASTNGFMEFNPALTLGLMVVFAVVILHRQFILSREIRTMKSQSAALAHYEDDIRRHLDTLARKINQLEAAPQQSTAQAITENPPNPTGESAAAATVAAVAAAAAVAESGSEVYPIDQFPRPDAAASKTRISGRKRTTKPVVLNEKSLNMHLQPIVELPSRRPAYFDAFMRLSSSDGEFVEQSEFRNLVETAGLTATIDKKVVFSSVRMVRKLNLLKKRAGVFCSLSPKSLLNLHSFREITGFLEANASLRQSLIIEMNNREFAGLNQEQRDRLAELSDMEIALCLGDVQDLKIDPDYLSRCGFRFVKIAASILLHADVDVTNDSILPANLAAMLEGQDIQLIATGVERDRDAISLIDMDLPLAQGLLFAPPRPVKAELLINAEPESQIKFKSSA